MNDRTVKPLRDSHRVSLSIGEIDELAAHLASLRQQITLSRNLGNIYAKLVVTQTKVGLGVKQADYTSTGTARQSAVAALLDDPESDEYIATYGTPEQKAALDASLVHFYDSGEVKHWKEFLVSDSTVAQFSESEAQIAVDVAIASEVSWKDLGKKLAD